MSLPSSTRLAARASLLSGPTTSRRASAISSSVRPAATAADVTTADRASAALAWFSRASENAITRTPTTLRLMSRTAASATTRSGSRRSSTASGTWVAPSSRPRASSDMRWVMCPLSSTAQTATYSTSSFRPSVASVSCRSAGSSKITAGAHESANKRVTALALNSFARSNPSRCERSRRIETPVVTSATIASVAPASLNATDEMRGSLTRRTDPGCSPRQEACPSWRRARRRFPRRSA